MDLYLIFTSQFVLKYGNSGLQVNQNSQWILLQT